MSENKIAFDKHNLRKKYCEKWLKKQQKNVREPIIISALFGVLNGWLLIMQTALIAFLLHQFIIEKQTLSFDVNFETLFSVDFSQLIIGLINSKTASPPLSPEYVQLAFFLLIVIFLVRSICLYYFQTFGFEAATDIKADIRDTLLNKFAVIPTLYLKQQQTTQLAQTTLEQVEALELYFARYCPQKILVILLPLLILLFVVPVNWVVAVIFLSTAPLMFIFMILTGMGANKASRHQFLDMARMSHYFLDRLQGLTTLKLFGQAQAESTNIQHVADNFRRSTMKVLRIAFLSSAALEFFSAISVALVAVYVGLGLLGLIHFGDVDKMSLQQALFVLIIAPEFFMPLKQLAIFYHDRATALAATDSILNILDAETVKPTPSYQSTIIAIELSNVSKFYQQRQIFKKINLQVKKGDKIALIGASGTGKTTLLRLMLGLELADEGEIRVDDSLKDYLSYLPQYPSIFHGSIEDNIRLFNPNFLEEEVEHAAHHAGVSAFSDSLKLGLKTVVGEKGYGLSGGQIQRIALARIFLKQASVILLDEPTAHIDNANKKRLLESIETLFHNKTVIIATHDPVVIESMPRRFVIPSA